MLDAIDVSKRIGPRDRALIGPMVYAFGGQRSESEARRGFLWQGRRL